MAADVVVLDIFESVRIRLEIIVIINIGDSTGRIFKFFIQMLTLAFISIFIRVVVVVTFILLYHSSATFVNFNFLLILK
jgi:hypothetical protein